MFSTACLQLVKEFGKDTLIPVPSLDKQGKVKPLQLVVMKKKRLFFKFTKCSYDPTDFQLKEVLQDDSSIPEHVEKGTLSPNYQNTVKVSFKGRFSLDFFAGVTIGSSQTATVQVNFGEVAKNEVNKQELIKELGKRKLNLNHPFIQQVRKNKKKVLCLVTGVVHLTGKGHLSRDTKLDAKAYVATQMQLPISVNTTASVENNKEIDLESNTVLAYNVHELKVNAEDGSMEMIMAVGLHGGFYVPVQYVAAPFARTPRTQDIDFHIQEEVFEAILDLTEQVRNELTSVILKMMSVPRDIQIFRKLVKKLESSKTEGINVQELEKQLLTEEKSWRYLLDLARIKVQESGELRAPEEKTQLLTCFGVLFDALSELQEEELDLIGKCERQTVPALFDTFEASLREIKVPLRDVEIILKDHQAIELLNQLGYSVSEQEIRPPINCLLTIDEVYVVMFALWGQKSK